MGVDRITQGNPSANFKNNFDSPGALVLDAANNVLYTTSNSKTLRSLHKNMDTIPPQTALTAITTAQNLLSVNLPAGYMSLVGRTVRVKLWLIYSTTIANVATLTFALVIGGVTVCTITTAATNTAASSNLPVQIEFEFQVQAAGAAGTVEAHGKVDANIGTAAAAAIASYLDTNTAVSSAINLIAAPTTLAVTIAASAAVPSAQVRMAEIQLFS